MEEGKGEENGLEIVDRQNLGHLARGGKLVQVQANVWVRVRV